MVSNKYLGMAISGLVIALFATQLSGYIGIETPNVASGQTTFCKLYQHEWLWKHNLNRSIIILVYWNALGFILALLAFKLWQTG